jgi:hypothetical protein
MPDVAQPFALNRLSPIASGSITSRSDVADASPRPAVDLKTTAIGTTYSFQAHTSPRTTSLGQKVMERMLT